MAYSSAFQCKVWEFSSFRKIVHTCCDSRVFGGAGQSCHVPDPRIRRAVARLFLVGRPIITVTAGLAGDDLNSILPDRFQRRVVSFDTREAPGTIVIDTGNTTLYYVLGGGRAIRYGVGVGREGFTWSGVQSVSRKAARPDWHPPAEMIARQPYLPRFVAGGPGNPLGAAAMYLGSSAYRIAWHK